ncbi:MAG: ATP-binding protein [Bacteroidales bacterium]|nr:ATP-binding protein [Bacteroidales bacterium]
MPEKTREELQQILKNEPDNYSKILELSNELSKFDKNNVRFSVDAGIINRLGMELVARHETAVSELVKNAYDADATKVKILFKNSSTLGGTLEIQDNGLGMTKEQLINGFMRLSSSEKLHFPMSTRYNRKRAGKKGIGRFSAQRLGKKLTIITQTGDAEQALKITVNWDDFLGDKDLLSITNQISLTDKVQDEGTILIIEQLRDTWTKATIERVYRYASEVLQPFPLSKTKKQAKTSDDPGFKLNCIKIDNGKKEIIADEKTMFFEHALAEIDGKVDNEGFMYLTLKSNKLGYREKSFLLNKDIPFEVLKNASIKAYYFVYGESEIPKTIEALIREKAKTQGAIRLYRNGFRVLPYGEKDDDWLGLDASVRRRTILPVHGNHNFFGFIEVNNDYGEQFEETSSREGLLNNNAFQELMEFGYQVITDAVLKIADVRGVKQKTNQKVWKKEPEEVITEAITELKEIVDSPNENNTENEQDKLLITKNRLSEIAQELETAQKEQKERKQEFIKEMNLLRILAALGLTIGEFIHEIKQYQGALQHDIKNIETSTTLENVLHVNKRVKVNLEGLSTYVSYFDEAFSENVQRELKPIELRTVVHALQSTLEADIAKRKIEFIEPKFSGYNLYTIAMHKSEWASILFNFYTNSRKAINRAKVDGKIFVECGKVYNTVYLEFSDNGDGIQLENRDKIFNAFYTTSTPVGKVVQTHEEMTGTGLGLKIVRDIITSYGGKIFIKEPTKGYSTTIRIELPWEKEGYKV